MISTGRLLTWASNYSRGQPSIATVATTANNTTSKAATSGSPSPHGSTI